MKFLLVISLVFITFDNLACSCKRTGVLKNKKSHDYVFKGRVVEVKDSMNWGVITDTQDSIEYRITQYDFNIIRHFKGLKHEKTVELLSGMTDCEVSFDKGQKYIVYSFTDNQKLSFDLWDQFTESYITSHLCGRTKKVKIWTFWESFVLWIT